MNVLEIYFSKHQHKKYNIHYLHCCVNNNKYFAQFKIFNQLPQWDVQNYDCYWFNLKDYVFFHFHRYHKNINFKITENIIKIRDSKILFLIALILTFYHLAQRWSIKWMSSRFDMSFSLTVFEQQSSWVLLYISFTLKLTYIIFVSVKVFFHIKVYIKIVSCSSLIKYFQKLLFWTFI